MPFLLLASKSPRRRELLAQIGVQCDVVDVDVEEQCGECETPFDYVQRLAKTKALAGYNAMSSQADIAVLGSDTVVVIDDQLLEKPQNEAESRMMLQLLSGREHRVLTAVAVCGNTGQEGFECCILVSTSKVLFRSISDVEISRYWMSGEPKDKAGSYGIQGFGAVFVRHIEGSYSGVMGLPLFETQQLLSHFNVSYWQQ